MTKDELRAQVAQALAERDAARTELATAAERLKELGEKVVELETALAAKDDAHQ